MWIKKPDVQTLTCVWKQQLTYTAAVYHSLRTGFVALFWRQTNTVLKRAGIK